MVTASLTVESIDVAACVAASIEPEGATAPCSFAVTMVGAPVLE